MAKVACGACGEVAGRGKRVGTKCACGGDFKSLASDLKSPEMPKSSGPGISRGAVLAKDNADLRAEVEHLKRQLAEANAKLAGIRTIPLAAIEEAAERRRERVSGAAASQNSNKATITPHGPRCQCIGCRVERVG